MFTLGSGDRLARRTRSSPNSHCSKDFIPSEGLFSGNYSRNTSVIRAASIDLTFWYASWFSLRGFCDGGPSRIYISTNFSNRLQNEDYIILLNIIKWLLGQHTRKSRTREKQPGKHYLINIFNFYYHLNLIGKIDSVYWIYSIINQFEKKINNITNLIGKSRYAIESLKNIPPDVTYLMIEIRVEMSTP